MKKSVDSFTSPQLTSDFLDLYFVRKSILKALRENLALFQGKLLDVGCGKMPYKEIILSESATTDYIGLDIEAAIEYDAKIKADYTWDGVKMPFTDESFDTVMATEVLEHCPDASIVVSEIYRTMKTGSYFFFTVPFLWNLHEVPHDEYRYTPFSLQRIFEAVGFKHVSINATGGWHASLAQMLGLWVRRAPMSAKRREVLSRLLLPVISKLISRDSLAITEFKEGQMITGLYGYCKK